MHRILIVGCVVGVVLAVSPLGAQVTTTTTSTSTTTTTLAGGCTPGDITLPGLDCRLTALIQLVDGTSGLGALGDGLRKRLRKGQDNLHSAIQSCDAHDGRAARKQVQQCRRQVTTSIAKIHSLRGRKLLKNHPDVVTALTDPAQTLANDLRDVRRSLDCP